MSIKKEITYSEKTGEVSFEREYHVPELFNQNGYYFWCKKEQSRVFKNIALPDIGLDNEGVFSRLCRKYLAEGSNFLQVATKNSVRPFNLRDLAIELGVSEKQARRRLNVQLEYGLLATLTIESMGTKETWLVVNPLYCISGPRLSTTLYILFRKQLDEHLSNYAKSEFAKRVSE